MGAFDFCVREVCGRQAVITVGPFVSGVGHEMREEETIKSGENGGYLFTQERATRVCARTGGEVAETASYGCRLK